ncbi:DUF7659 family protein [Haliea sp.]|uniref:DUF7659 family protein n=1 Tax=Haliea sp. TaxID=1932666 RepID=UPI000C3667C4|nr:hypothetical protein [Haliea sp.]MAD65720.1 hypothetical protein [Haliea sp.]
MKTLTDYTQKQQTELFEKTGTFFAFSNDQFYEQYQPGKKYVSLGCGMYTPKESVREVVDGLEAIHKAGIQQDIDENGKAAIIERELHNHEAFYVCRIEDTVRALESYNIGEDEIRKEYRRLAPTVEL